MPQTNPVSATEASSQTGIPKRTLLWAIRQGKLPAHKLGGSTGAYLIQPRDLDKFVAKRRAELQDKVEKRQRSLEQQRRDLDRYVEKREQAAS